MNDMLGREIEVGDVVAYPSISRKILDMRIAVVDGIHDEYVTVSQPFVRTDGSVIVTRSRLHKTERSIKINNGLVYLASTSTKDENESTRMLSLYKLSVELTTST